MVQYLLIKIGLCVADLYKYLSENEKGGIYMAQTDDGKKKVHVQPHTKDDGTKVKRHYRSTPSTSKGAGKGKK
jgi:hypothetical protein